MADEGTRESSDLDRRAERGFRRPVIIVALGIMAVNLVSALIGVSGEQDLNTGDYAIIAAGILFPAAVTIGLMLLGQRLFSLGRSPIWAADRAMGRRARAAIRKGRHLTGDDEIIALDVARQLVRQRWALPLLGVLLGSAGIYLIGTGSPVLGWLGVAVGLGALGAAVVRRRDPQYAATYLVTAAPAQDRP